LGIGASDVSFGWALEAHANGAVQSAYQLRLGTLAGEGDIWSPERVRSGRQVDVRLPDRIRLAPATRYFWQVKTWDGGGDESAWSEPAWFETGLLNESDWRGAEWIGRSIEEPEPWSDFKTAVEFTLENEALGVFLRASADGREACMWQINVTGKNPVLRTHRKKDGNYQVLADTDLTKHGFTNDSIRNGKHTLVFDVFGSTITTKLDGKEIDRFSGDIPRRGFIGLRTYGNERARIHRIKASNSKGSALLAEDHGDAGLTVSGGSEAILTGNPVSLPLLRGEFHAKKPVTSARVYASARGIYELTCNGGKVGNQRLAPGWTDYHQRIQAQTYDITAMVKPGANVLGAALADGWYRGKVGLGWTKAYGEQTAFVAKIRLTYDDGTTEWFSTNRSWRADGGPFLTGDLQDGETYDARREQAGWDTPEFDASRWKPVTVLANDSAKLVPQPDDPVRETEVLTAKSMTTPAPGTHVYDLGQNMVGVTRIRLTGRKGQTATIRHAEELHRSGERKGQLYTDNFRSAKVTDRYTFAEDGSVV
ncbi:MAG: family 78 glycoside hydrolase catalytic domain, partial [Verrucomicrobiae bacterium]|nr:family 78 glycoside hydrolase catalytic domain [Verrucomicrobiae bacterium]